MNPANQLRNAGQSVWLDTITRKLLNDGTLKRYIDELSLAGLTSNPTIFDQALRGGDTYDADIRAKMAAGAGGEELFFQLALDDLTRAADLFRPVHDRSDGVDGWVSLEVSPKLAYDTQSTLAQVRELHRRGGRPNLFIKIPGTVQGLPAIEESIFNGVPINVTLLFSCDHYLAAADAYMRGIERRVAAGLNPRVASVASLFVSRWDTAVAGKVPAELEDRIGLAVAKRTYRAYLDVLASDRWLRLLNLGARPQRLLWASTGTKNPKAPDLLFVEGLFAPHTINTMPEKTLHALVDHGKIGAPLAHDGGDAEAMLAAFRRAGIDVGAVAEKLQQDGAAAFVKSWDALLACVEDKSGALKKAG